jgi:hypothetical protein
MRSGAKRAQREAVSQASLKVRSIHAVMRKRSRRPVKAAARRVNVTERVSCPVLVRGPKTSRSAFQCKASRTTPRSNRKLAK